MKHSMKFLGHECGNFEEKNKLNPSFILAEARKLNNSLAGEYSQKQVLKIATKLYQSNLHWHTVAGKCYHGEAPFEIMMPILSLLISTWTADIYLRKARDRTAPKMIERYLWWKNFLFACLSFTEYKIISTRDLRAEKAFHKDKKRINRFLCALKILLKGY